MEDDIDYIDLSDFNYSREDADDDYDPMFDDEYLHPDGNNIEGSDEY